MGSEGSQRLHRDSIGVSEQNFFKYGVSCAWEFGGGGADCDRQGSASV